MIVIILFSLFCRKKTETDVKIISSTVLSINGSTRATAYMMSNKTITANNKIFVAWLDKPSDIQIKMYDIQTDQWSETVLLGMGIDNHAGPAITMDSQGYIHAVFGPHHNPFQYRVSKNPYDINEWSEIERFGITATYPSLLCDAEDNLHIVYRGGNEPWGIIYQNKTKGQVWSEPVEIVHAGVKDGYTQYGNPLVLSSDGVLHLAFHIYDMHPAAGKSIGYLKSEDNGKTWENVKGERIELPAKPGTNCYIEQSETLDMRIGNVAVDSNGIPWLTAFHNETNPRTSLLWHFDGVKWHSQNLVLEIQNVYPEWELLYCGLTFDRDGIMYIPAIIQKIEGSTHWGDPSQETILLYSSDKGASFKILPISELDPSLPNWLINIERPYSPKKIGVPSLLYTHGNPGTTVTDGDATEVIYVRFGK